jgi:hypothetical protein
MPVCRGSNRNKKNSYHGRRNLASHMCCLHFAKCSDLRDDCPKIEPGGDSAGTLMVKAGRALTFHVLIVTFKGYGTR